MSIAFTKDYDVVIGGAGISGIAAALAAARSGCRTALIEKTVMPGGLASAGMVNIYLPLCDGEGRQVLFGLAEELLLRSSSYGPGGAGSGWNGNPGLRERRYLSVFSPGAAILAYDELLEAAGVDIWYDSLICAVGITDGRVNSVEIENKSGRGEVRGKVFIDATGDADIAHLAGARCRDGSNKLSIWAIEANLDAAIQAVSEGDGIRLMQLIRLGANDAGIGHPEGAPVWEGVSGKKVSEFTLASRRLLREHYQKRHADLENGRNREFVLSVPAMAQFRTTRRITGCRTMKSSDVNRAGIPDAVGLFPDWRNKGRVWELPFGSMLPEGVDGLMAVGRCLDAEEDDAWQVARVIPCAAHSGQVAGYAAALSIRQCCIPSEISIGQLQELLRSKNIPCGFDDLPCDDAR